MGFCLFITAVVLGLVEGATEFIPVSSTGHLIIVSDWPGYTGRQASAFAVFVQPGTILAIPWFYRRTFTDVVATWNRNRGSRRFRVNVGIARIPAAAVGFLAHDWLLAHLFGPVTVAWALIVGGVLIPAMETWELPTSIDRVSLMPLRMTIG